MKIHHLRYWKEGEYEIQQTNAGQVQPVIKMQGNMSNKFNLNTKLHLPVAGHFL